jgi:hypothetical protein
MKNLLNFDQYRQQVRIYEAQVYQQEMKKLNEGLITKLKKHKATKVVDKILADEIAMGRDFEERIKETLAEIKRACDELKEKSKTSSEFTQRVNGIIDEINKVSFDTLSLLGDQDIDFSGFRTSVIMANVAKFGAIFSPIKNGLMIKKAYDYFIGLIKQTIRKDLIMLIVNFDQFQNTVLQRSLESVENARNQSEIDQAIGATKNEFEKIISGLIKNDRKKQQEWLKVQKDLRKDQEERRKTNPVLNVFANAYDNTYKMTSEALKSYTTEDTQKQLDALKNSINRLGSGNEDLSIYGELLIAAAEEKSLKTSNAIHSNFLKLSEVFKLSNQKNLIELISEAEKEEQKRINEETKETKKKFDGDYFEARLEFLKSEFEKIKKDKDLGSISLKEIEKLKDDEVEFKFSDDDSGMDKKETKTKYDILTEYLSNTEGIDDIIESCSYDLRMLIINQDVNEGHSYRDYMTVLGETVDKMVVDAGTYSDKEYYLDFSALDSVDEIEKVLKYFKPTKKGEKDRDKQNLMLSYIDSLTKFPYEVLVEKLNDIYTEKEYDKILDKFKSYRKKLEKWKKTVDEDKRKEASEKLKNFKKLGPDGYVKSKRTEGSTEEEGKLKEEYNEELKKHEKTVKDTDRPKSPIRTSLNKDDYKNLKEGFKNMREHISGEKTEHDK